MILNDVGSDGDDTVHDDIWTAHIQHSGVEHGEFQLNVTISDGWSTIIDTDSVMIDNLAPRLKSVEYQPQVVEEEIPWMSRLKSRTYMVLHRIN